MVEKNEKGESQKTVKKGAKLNAEKIRLAQEQRKKGDN